MHHISIRKLIFALGTAALLLCGCRVEPAHAAFSSSLSSVPAASSVASNAVSRAVSSKPSASERVSRAVSSKSTVSSKATSSSKSSASSQTVSKPKVGFKTSKSSGTAVSSKSIQSSRASSQKAAVSSRASAVSSQTASSGPTVTVLINCSNAARWNEQNGNKLSAEAVPKSGVILAETAVALQKGDTVYSVLVRTGETYNLHVVHSGSYISAIHGLNQFDCGSASGWMYSVNGTYPSAACGSYALKSGDRIEWHYTCTSGDLK